MQTVDEDVPLMDRTLDILMNSIQDKSVEDARYEDMPEFLGSRKQWCKKAASYVLERKGKRYECWKKEFLHFAFDPLAIMIWARCYRRHVAFFMNYHFWCTQKQDNVTKCDIVLAFRGGACFQATRIMTTEEYSKAEQGIAHVQAYFDEISSRENVQNMHRKRAKEYRRKVDKIESSDEESAEEDEHTSEEELDLEKVMEDEDNGSTVVTSMVNPGLDLRKDKNKKNENNNMQKEDSDYVQGKDIDGNNMQKTDTPAHDGGNTDAGKETEPLNTDVKNANDGRNTDDDDKSSSNPSDSDSSSSVAADDDNNMLKKRKIQGAKPKAVRALFKTYHCLAAPCTVTKQSKVAVLKHMKSCHKDYCYKCNKCPKSFASYIGHYKH